MGSAIRGVVVSGVVLAGCSDVVVGHFGGTANGGGSGEGSGVGEESTAADSTTGAMTSGFLPTAAMPTGDSSGEPETTGPPDVDPWQSGCFGDDFEDGTIDANMWNVWMDGDSFAEEAEGFFYFTPPTSGVLDTGLITNYLHFINFDYGTIRVQVPSPPDAGRPVVLFVSIQEYWQDAVLSFKIAEGAASIAGRANGVEAFDDVVGGVTDPPWVGLRAEGDLVHFETSPDGVDWSTVATRDKPAGFAYGQPFFMVQTYGNYPDPVAVKLDNFEVCLD